MTHVAYIAPNFTANAVRFIEALTALHDIRLFIISQESIALLPLWQQSRVFGARQVSDVQDKWTLIKTLTELQTSFGRFHRILGATEQLQVPMAEARIALGVPGMDVKTAHNFRDKSLMKTLFDENKIPCARHGYVTEYDAAIAFTHTCPYPVVVKPVAGAGSQTTYKVNTDQEMMSAFTSLGHLSAEGVIIEEFIQGEEFSLDTFSLNGKILGQTINHYNPNPLEVMSNPWIQWRVMLRKEVTHKAYDDIRQAGKKALDVLGMKTGISHMEWFRRKDGSIAISEIAARPPGAQFTTLISRACDIDVVRSWMRLMIYDEPVNPEIKYSAGAAYLRGQGSGRVLLVEGIEEIRSRYNDIITDIRVPKIGQEKSQSYEGEGFIILRHKDSGIVERALDDIVKTVRVVLN
ncbi:MAG: ATP-grasp domain-containing protein [Bacteroidota bacterium]|nr:ATP-grasp domain-containing protein [Bacteroidota bacterium]